MSKTSYLLLVIAIALSTLTSCGGKKNDSGVIINGVKWATRNVDEAGFFAPTP